MNDTNEALGRSPSCIFDALGGGVLLLDADGCVLHANPEAAALLRAGEPLRLHRRTLTAASADGARRIAALLRNALAGEPAASVTLANDCGCAYTIVASPLRGAVGAAAVGLGIGLAQPAAIVLVAEAMNAPGVDEAWLRQTYGLTPTEARVVLAAMQGGSVAEIAARMGISVNTVKTHISRILDKTGIARRAELVRLMMTQPCGAFAPGRDAGSGRCSTRGAPLRRRRRLSAEVGRHLWTGNCNGSPGLSL